MINDTEVIQPKRSTYHTFHLHSMHKDVLLDLNTLLSFFTMSGHGGGGPFQHQLRIPQNVRGKVVPIKQGKRRQKGVVASGSRGGKWRQATSANLDGGCPRLRSLEALGV